MRAASSGTGYHDARHAIFVILSVVLLVVCAVYVNTAVGYLPVLFALFAIIICLIYVRVLRKTIVYDERGLFQTCTRGSEGDFVIRLKNLFWLFYPRIDIVFSSSDPSEGSAVIETMPVSLAAHETRDFIFALSFSHIGIYTVGLRRMVLHDPLLLFRTSIAADADYRVDVTPRCHRVDCLTDVELSLTESDTACLNTLQDGLDYASVRDYVTGDAMKNIHWKLSARTDRLYTKLYESYGVPGLSVLIDTHAPDYDRETLMDVYDCVVETAVSIERFALDEGMETNILFKDAEGGRCAFTQRSDPQFLELLRRLPPISSTERAEDCRELLEEEIRGLYSMGNIAICTPYLDEALVTLLIQTRGQGKTPLLFLAVPRGLEPEERAEATRPLRRLAGEGIFYLVLESAEDLGGASR